jgi:hypothetical protein
MRKVMSVVMSVALVLTLFGTGVAAERVDTKEEKDLVAEGQKIDKAAAPSDPSRVTARIVSEWNGTKFTFGPNSAPRELTAQDVQRLRQKRLGYGEISILLALTAKQPDPATAKSLGEILAMRQADGGWGTVAKELGYKNLGAVLKSVKATAHEVAAVSAARGPKLDTTRKAEKLEKNEKIAKPEKPDKPERPEKPQHTGG